MAHNQSVRSYAEAKALLDLRKKQGRDYAKLRHNVYLEPRGENIIAVCYHDTDIVTYYSDGKIVLHSDGWHTMTTKQNINFFSPFHVHQKKRVWYVTRAVCDDDNRLDKVVRFEDGMILTAPSHTAA